MKPTFPTAVGQQVVSLLLKKLKSGTYEMLAGLKATGPLAGYIVPPGGKIKPEDKTALHGTKRETREESKLRASKGVLIAKLTIKITSAKQEFDVLFFEFREWEGELENRTPEYFWLKFISLEQYPWGKSIPGDEKWLKQIIESRIKETYWWKQAGQIPHITVVCGENRKDVKDIITGVCTVI